MAVQIWAQFEMYRSSVPLCLIINRLVPTWSKERGQLEPDMSETWSLVSFLFIVRRRVNSTST
eukprot:2839941-Amphidinium_carterae.1